MRMLGELPCNVANTKVIHTPSGDVLLVERFDIYKGKPHSHFLSANSIFSMNKVSNACMCTEYTYGYLGEFIMKYVSEPADAYDLYYRMVFNVLMGNTDDHSRNHAMLYNFTHGHWRLSPAYDVLPINHSRQHGIGIGDDGRVGSLENLISQSKRFGLKPFKARRMVDEVKELVSEWAIYFRNHNVGEGDITRLKHVIPLF